MILEGNSGGTRFAHIIAAGDLTVARNAKVTGTFVSAWGLNPDRQFVDHPKGMKGT